MPECGMGDSGNEIYAEGFGLCRLNILSGFDALLIGPNGCGICVGRFVRDEPDLCLAHHDMGRVYGSYGAHISPLEGGSSKVAAIHSCFLKGFS